MNVAGAAVHPPVVMSIQFTATTGTDRITGVTMRSGVEIRFVHRGARIANDTLYAAGTQNEIRLPRDSIAGVSRSKVSIGRVAVRPLRMVSLSDLLEELDTEIHG